MAPQSYYLGGKIRASDFNGFADDINEIVGIGAGDSGYGQNQLVIPHVASGTKINASHMQLLLTALKFAGRHQGTTINSPEDTNDPEFPSAGQIIKLLPNLEVDITNVRANKLNFDIAQMTAESNKISSSKTFDVPGAGAVHTWSSNVNYEVSVIFADEDARRHFFNTGSDLRIDTSLTGVDASHKQSVDWQTMFSNIGILKLSHNLTEAAGGVGTPAGGFTSLTSTYAKIYEKSGGDGSSGYYTNNQFEVYARLNGNNAIDFKLDFIDAYTTSTFNLTDYVAGTLTVQLDLLRADDQDASGNGVVITSPTFSHISQL
ncbi:MAG: hypothetical protein CMD92_05920 [Gammaproteobacteria bacterium]|nr:hypothetical protein [Gammaproteobacteria bacterium]